MGLYHPRSAAVLDRCLLIIDRLTREQVWVAVIVYLVIVLGALSYWATR